MFGLMRGDTRLFGWSLIGLAVCLACADAKEPMDVGGQMGVAGTSVSEVGQPLVGSWLLDKGTFRLELTLGEAGTWRILVEDPGVQVSDHGTWTSTATEIHFTNDCDEDELSGVPEDCGEVDVCEYTLAGDSLTINIPLGGTKNTMTDVLVRQ